MAGTFANDPAALAACLPDELRSFGSFVDPDDFRSHATAVTNWLNAQLPGAAEHLTLRIMTAAGLNTANWYRMALSAQPG